MSGMAGLVDRSGHRSPHDGGSDAPPQRARRVQVVRWFQADRREVADLRCIDSVGVGTDEGTLRDLGSDRRPGDAEQGDGGPTAPGRRRSAPRRRIRRWRSRRAGGRPPRSRTRSARPRPGSARRQAARRRPALSPRCRRRSRRPRTDPHSGGPADVELGVERERNGGVLGGRIGVGDRPADRATVADLEVADQRRGRGQERNVADLQLTLADHRSDHQTCPFTRSSRRSDATRPMSTRLANAGQPEVEHRDQALAAGEHLGVVAVFAEERDDLVDGRRSVVLERCRLQRPSSVKVESD